MCNQNVDCITFMLSGGGGGGLSVEKRGWSGYYVKFRADYVVSSSVTVVFIGVRKVCVSCHTIMHYVRH